MVVFRESTSNIAWGEIRGKERADSCRSGSTDVLFSSECVLRSCAYEEATRGDQFWELASMSTSVCLSSR